MTLGEKIKILRKRKYTQEELAYRLGVHVNTVLKWEHGDRKPTADKLKELANVLDTPIDYLLNETDDSALQENQTRTDPPAQERSVIEKNRGTLIYTFKDGERLELPDTDRGYALFERILMQKAVMV